MLAISRRQVGADRTILGHDYGAEAVHRDNLVHCLNWKLRRDWRRRRRPLSAPSAGREGRLRKLAGLSTTVKNRGPRGHRQRRSSERQDEILAANAQDVERARDAGLADAPLNRLRLTPEKIAGIANDVRTVASLPDPVGEVIDGRTLPNGLRSAAAACPWACSAAIFESRPNVTIDIASLCLKSGNACVLRGGSEAIRSNTVLARIAARGRDRGRRARRRAAAHREHGPRPGRPSC